MFFTPGVSTEPLTAGVISDLGLFGSGTAADDGAQAAATADDVPGQLQLAGALPVTQPVSRVDSAAEVRSALVPSAATPIVSLQPTSEVAVAIKTRAQLAAELDVRLAQLTPLNNQLLMQLQTGVARGMPYPNGTRAPDPMDVVHAKIEALGRHMAMVSGLARQAIAVARLHD